jgi:hypothetical protein
MSVPGAHIGYADSFYDAHCRVRAAIEDGTVRLVVGTMGRSHDGLYNGTVDASHGDWQAWVPTS